MYEREVMGVPTVARHRACVAPTRYRTEALGRLKGPLRRSMIQCIAPLTRPARFRRFGSYRSDANLSSPEDRDGGTEPERQRQDGGRETRALSS